MSAAAQPRRPGRRWAPRGLVVLLVACAGILLAAPMALAATVTRLDSPAPGGAVDEPVQVLVTVTTGPDEELRAVEARLGFGADPPGPARSLDPLGGSPDGETRWATELDPLASWAQGDGRPMRNGVWSVQVRALTAGGPTPWTDDSVRFAVPPPAVEVTTDPAPDDGGVTIGWTRTTVADFARSTVERRAAGNGAFQPVAAFEEAGTLSYVDATAPDGPLEYRVVTARADGAGGELATPSSSSAVTLRAQPAPSPATTAAPPPAPAPQGGGQEPAGSGAQDPAGGTRPLDTTTFRRTLPLPSGAPAPPAVADDATREAPTGAVTTPGDGTPRAEDPSEDQLAADLPGPSRSLPGSGSLRVADGGRSGLQRVLPQIAGGLLCALIGAHVLRFRWADGRASVPRGQGRTTRRR